jgi:cytochrome c oxidase subunit 1
MHWLGLMARSQTVGGDLVALSSLGASLRTFITVATLVTVGAQALFLINFAWSLARGQKSQDRNPWRSATLEWTVSSPPPFDNFGATEPIIYRGAYEFSASGVVPDFLSQNAVPAPSESLSQAKQASETSSRKE